MRVAWKVKVGKGLQSSIMIGQREPAPTSTPFIGCPL